MSELRVYLRGVDIANLTQKYLAGEFKDLTNPIPLAKILPPTQIRDVRIAVPETKSYQVELGGQTLACIGYKVYAKDGFYANYLPDKAYRCMQCLQKINGQCMGIPILREERSGKIHYHMLDVFCSFRCIYTEIIRRRHNALYNSSMSCLGEIYEKATGSSISELKPLSDRRLLKMFNGPMSWAEYHTDTKYYPEKPGSVFFLPVPEYLEQEVLK